MYSNRQVDRGEIRKMTEQTRTKLTNFVKRIKEEAYEEGFSDGYEKGLIQDVIEE